MKDQPSISEKTKFSLTFNNIWAILVAILLASVSWFNLSTNIALLSQKLDLFITNEQTIMDNQDKRLSDVEARQRDGLNRLGIVETKISDLRK